MTFLTNPYIVSSNKSVDLVRASSQYLEAADSASLSITGSMTIEFWLKVNGLPSAGTAYNLASKWVDAGQRTWFLDYFNNGGTKQFRFGTSSTGANGSTGTLNYDLSDATWTHLAVVRDGATAGLEFFVNGTSVGTSSTAHTSVFDSTAGFEIGASDGGLNTFNGKFSNVRMWNVKRTGTEINDNKSLVINSASNLQGSWTLYGVLTDGSGNGNTLTNNNAAAFSTDAPF